MVQIPKIVFLILVVGTIGIGFLTFSYVQQAFSHPDVHTMPVSGIAFDNATINSNTQITAYLECLGKTFNITTVYVDGIQQSMIPHFL